MSVAKLSAAIGSLLCLLSVCLGAFGAHALAPLLQQNQRTDVFELASQYQFYHGLTLIGVAALLEMQWIRSFLPVWFFTIGTIIFSGSLYLLATLNMPMLGAITPIGGSLLIIAWLVVLFQLCSKASE